MNKMSFNFVLRTLTPVLVHNRFKTSYSSGGVITPAVQLSIAIHVLPGGLYYDAVMNWVVGRSTSFQIFPNTLCAMDDSLSIPGIPITDNEKLNGLATGFERSKIHSNRLFGYVAAVDGIAIEVTKIVDKFVPRNFSFCKTTYALPLQAAVDVKYRFPCISFVVLTAHTMQWLSTYLRLRTTFTLVKW